MLRLAFRSQSESHSAARTNGGAIWIGNRSSAESRLPGSPVEWGPPAKELIGFVAVEEPTSARPSCFANSTPIWMSLGVLGLSERGLAHAGCYPQADVNIPPHSGAVTGKRRIDGHGSYRQPLTPRGRAYGSGAADIDANLRSASIPCSRSRVGGVRRGSAASCRRSRSPDLPRWPAVWSRCTC